MSVKVASAMLLSAGLGTRMRPLTDAMPKPMLKVAGKPMIDYALDKCVAAGVQRAVINLHYRGEVIEEHLKTRTDIEIVYSREPELLESGGGVKNALASLGEAPFYCINTDVVTLDGARPMLHEMAERWNDARMDIMLLMKRQDEAMGFESAQGDYFMTLEDARFGAVHGRTAPPPRAFVFVSTILMHPRVYAGIADAVFSNRVVFDAAEKAGRLFGLVHDGAVYHASTPDDLARINAQFVK